MKRYLCWLAVLGAATVPDWAAACDRPFWVQTYWVPPPVYVPAYQPPCVPVYEVPLPPPRITTVPARDSAPLAPPAIATTPKPAPSIPPAVAAPSPSSEPTFRPAGGMTPVTPEVVKPAANVTPPMPPVVIPDPPPKKAEPLPKLPPVELPALPGGSALPSPAPAPTDPGPMIPSPMLPIPPADPKKPANDKDALPPLVLPPESGGPPTGIVPPMSTSKSSPIAARGMSVEVFAAAGSVAGPTRKVGFFNHTNADIELAIEGRAVTLPRKTYIHAELPPTFKWKHGENAAETATVPTGAAGLDVVFRE